MATVLTTKFIESNIPFSGKRYKCITYNSELYIFVDRFGVYKYDYVNNIFSTVLVNNSVGYNCILYGNSVIFVSSYYISNSNRHAVIQLSKYDFENNTITNFLTVNGTLRTEYVSSPSDWRNTIYMGEIHKKNNSLYISWTGNYIYPSTGQLGREYNELIEVNLNDISFKTVNNSFAHYCTYDEYFFSGASAVGINRFNHHKLYGNGDSVVSYNFDLFGGCCFAIEQYYYLLGGENNPTQIIRFDSVSKNFEISEAFSLPQNTVNLNVGEYYDGNNNYIIFYDNGIFVITVVNYNLTYTITDKTGTTVLTRITNQAPITKIRFNYSMVSNNIGYVIDTQAESNAGSYPVDTPEGYVLVGFSNKPNSKNVQFELNTDIEVNIATDFTFYEVYQRYQPPKTTFSLNFYQNTAESNRVDKSAFLTSVGTLSGVLRESCSIVSPVLTIEYPKVPDFNYVYIEAFGRYYFVTGVTSVRYNLWEISLECDVLMTYKDKLLECEAFIDRNENTFNPLIVDRRKVIEQGQNIITLAANNEVFEGTGSYIISLSNGFMTTIYSYVYFDSGVTVKFNGKEVSSGDSAITVDRYPITIECTKEKCYINGNIYSAETTLTGMFTSLYIHTEGATVTPFTITIVKSEEI